MNIEQLYAQATAWYTKQTSWKKVLFFGVLALLAILAALYAVLKYFLPTPLPPADGTHTAVVARVEANIQAALKHHETELAAKKLAALNLVQDRTDINNNNKKTRAAIVNAKSFNEIDEIIRGLK